jgi:hypothetical protein
MKLRERPTTTGRPDAELLDSSAESIRIARLPPIAEPDARPDAAVPVEPYPAPTVEPWRAPVATELARLRFAPDPPRGMPAGLRRALSAIAAIVLVLVAVVLMSSANATSHRSHANAAKLTPAQQRVEAARRARAAAIVKARRDRGTDAELQDTIPAAVPPPGQ